MTYSTVEIAAMVGGAVLGGLILGFFLWRFRRAPVNTRKVAAAEAELHEARAHLDEVIGERDEIGAERDELVVQIRRLRDDKTSLERQLGLATSRLGTADDPASGD